MLGYRTVNTFNYLRYHMSCEREKDLNVQGAEFVEILKLISQFSRRHYCLRIQEHFIDQCYFIIVNNGHLALVRREKVVSVEMCFMRDTAICTFFGS
jgi:hypothetical protein